MATGEASPTERLLRRSRVESIVSERAGPFTRRVAFLAGDLSDEELERLVPAVRAAFDPALLRADVAAFIESEAPDGLIERVLVWLEGGASAELARLAEERPPSGTLRDFVEGLPGALPDSAHVRLVAEWTRVQGAGGFFVLMDQALEEAAYAVTGQLRPGFDPFVPLSGDPLFDRLQASFDAGLVSFLHRYQNVPGPVVEAATREYAGEDGQWLVGTYSLAVAEALRAAGARVVRALERGDAPAPAADASPPVRPAADGSTRPSPVADPSDQPSGKRSETMSRWSALTSG